MSVPDRHRTLGLATYSPVYCHAGSMYLDVGTGRVLEHLAPRYDTVCLCAPRVDGPPASATDLRLEVSNVELIVQPYYNSVVGALKQLPAVARAYHALCTKADVIFVRGLLPALGLLYFLAWLRGCRIGQWVIGNPVALLKAHPRRGWLIDTLALVYARQDRLLCRIGRRLTGSAFICNGQELGAIYASPRTHVVYSSVISADEFFVRADTCTGPRVRILYLGYIRPEKGLEYLFEAMPLLRTRRPWELVIVGSWTKFEAFRGRLTDIVARAGLANRVRWEGYVSFGQPLLERMRAADVFVLPSLSEGTPHTLVEARANSLPVVATHVGGIPTGVTDGFDGLLVPPRDAPALAAAIDRVIEDGELRRRLIENGRETARRLTIECFAERVYAVLEDLRRETIA